VWGWCCFAIFGVCEGVGVCDEVGGVGVDLVVVVGVVLWVVVGLSWLAVFWSMLVRPCSRIFEFFMLFVWFGVGCLWFGVVFGGCFLFVGCVGVCIFFVCL
jgi:hypothetical protein